jgi:hypothetical protein
MGDETTIGDVGSSGMTVVNSAGQDNELVWNGLETNAGGVTAGFTPAAGALIIYIDFIHCVDLQVASASNFRVHNGCSSTKAGSVTEVW